MTDKKILSLLDRLPPRPSPLEIGKIVEPVAPFRGIEADSFTAWVEQANYQAGNPPLSAGEIDTLREAWGK